jgi:hypothetical protein
MRLLDERDDLYSARMYDAGAVLECAHLSLSKALIQEVLVTLNNNMLFKEIITSMGLIIGMIYWY